MSGVIPTSTVEKPVLAFQPCWWGVLTKEEKEGKREKEEKREERKEERGKIRDSPSPHSVSQIKNAARNTHHAHHGLRAPFSSLDVD